MIQDRESLNKRTIPVHANYTEREIVGVDSSSVTIGKTDVGIIAAVKAAAVFSDHIETFGPFVCHITESNKGKIYDYYMQNVFALNLDFAAPQLTKMPDRLRNFCERLVQKYCSIYPA